MNHPVHSEEAAAEPDVFKHNKQKSLANPVIFPPPKTKGRQIDDLEDKEKKHDPDSEWDEIRLAIAADELEDELEHEEEEDQQYQEHEHEEDQEDVQEFVAYHESEEEADEEEFCDEEECEEEFCDEDDYPWGADDEDDKKKCKDKEPCLPVPCIHECPPHVPDCEHKKPCPEPVCDKKPDPPIICKTTEVQLPVNLASEPVTIDILERLDIGFPIARFIAIDWSLKSYNGKVVLPSNVLFLCLVLLADVQYADAEGEMKSLKMEIPLEKTVSLEWINAPDIPSQYDAEYTFRTPGSTDVITQRASCTELTHKPYFEAKVINIVSHEEAVKSDSGDTVIYVQGRVIAGVDVYQKQFVHVVTELP
ncbi:hypothetical protein [Thalassobacillus pellis]|uniref:hypothetical protein n=1 Tax=Thalassobacillus pellis TaxID=748008 RepID=UPI00195FA7F1|nr:hypothetical protein [Thalassobacillus pellis]MBM7553112.1 hypothetical protein [Thalassobacillus pellis]